MGNGTFSAHRAVIIGKAVGAVFDYLQIILSIALLNRPDHDDHSDHHRHHDDHHALHHLLISTGQLIIPVGQFPLSLLLLSHPPPSQTDRQPFLLTFTFLQFNH